MIVYVIEMIRNGDREQHSYIAGVFSDRKIAEYEAQLHVNMRAGKYCAEITEEYVDCHSTRRVVCFLDGGNYSDDEDLENDIKSRKDYLKYRESMLNAKYEG